MTFARLFSCMVDTTKLFNGKEKNHEKNYPILSRFSPCVRSIPGCGGWIRGFIQ
jgi:hypothetical protein